MKTVAIGVGLLATAIVAAGLVYEYDKLCCGPPRIPLDEYWMDRIKAAHDHAAPRLSEPRE
jgi:hypothetical protein